MKSKFNFSENEGLLFISVVVSVVLFVLLLFRLTGLICDEKDNYAQILNFIKGDYHLLEISALPGYHVVMALLLKLSGHISLFAARCITVVFGLLSVCIFYLLTQRLFSENSILRTAQFFFFPPIFIFYFMIYTDILSLLFVILMLLFALDRRYVVSGIFGICSMLIRQNNVIWVSFIPALYLYESFGFNIPLQKLLGIFKETWFFFLGIAMFIVFVILNHGVAMGDAASHPAFMFSTGNIFFLLFCSFGLFLPIHIANWPDIVRYFKGNKWPKFISIALFLFYWLTFKSDHPYNQMATYYFIRNMILVKVATSVLLKFIFFLPILYCFWSITVTPLGKRSWYLFYWFTIIFLIPSWLIEQRYYIIPFTLFMLFRTEYPERVERISVVYYIVILCLLLPYITSMKLFL